MSQEPDIRVLKVEPGQAPVAITMPNTLKAFQEAVGGLIECLGLGGGACLICNEEGKLLGLPGNRWLENDPIAGTFLVVGDDGSGAFSSLSDAILQQYAEQFAVPDLFMPGEPEQNTGFKFITL